MPHRGDVCCAVVTVEVAAPLSVALDGGAAILSCAVVLDLDAEVIHGEASCRQRP
jgi:hypothetical protein